MKTSLHITGVVDFEIGLSQRLAKRVRSFAPDGAPDEEETGIDPDDGDLPQPDDPDVAGDPPPSGPPN